MKAILVTTSALLLLAVLPALHSQAEALLAKTHHGARENQVANNWHSALPTFIHSQTSRNQFPRTHLPFDVDDKDPNRPRAIAMRTGVNKFEIRDANNREFRAFLMTQNGVDGNGLPIYVVTQKAIWLPWKSWPAKYILETYPVESNPEAKDLVAFAVWLYSERENQLANRVLTVAHGMDSELAPLIEGYICEKEKWTLPDDGLEEWSAWDMEYQKERKMLVTPEHRTKLQAEREREADRIYKELVASRGDYRGPYERRRRSPTKQLIFVEWEIKQFKLAFGGSDLLKDEKKQEELQTILDSITDDRAHIDAERKKLREIDTTGKPNDQERKAQAYEGLLRLDPMDVSLRAEVAQAWFVWANPDQWGNSCDRVQGLKNAIPHYEEILKVYPNNTAFLIQMGRCYQAQEDSKNARVYYEKVIEIDGTGGQAPTAKALIRNMDIKDQNRRGSK